jgi:putative transposase
MVEHPSEYPWSSYQHNALGKMSELITPHNLYKKLGLSNKQRQKAYQALFNGHIDEKTLSDIRESTNKAWVLGSAYFKALIEKKLERSCSPKPKGGDRRSDEYKQKTKSIESVQNSVSG